MSLLHIASKLKPRNGNQQLTGRQSGGSRQRAEVNLTIPQQGHYARLLCSHLGTGPALGIRATPAANSNPSPVLQRRPTAQVYPQLCDELLRRLQQLCTLTQQVETAGAVPVEQGPWRGEHLPALLNGSGCRDQGAAGAACLDHNGGQAQAGQGSIAPGKMPAVGYSTRAKLGQQCASGLNIPGQPPVFAGIDAIQARGHDRQGLPTTVQRPAVSGSIDALRQTADHKKPRRGKCPRHPFSKPQPIPGWLPCTHYSDGRLTQA